MNKSNIDALLAHFKVVRVTIRSGKQAMLDQIKECGMDAEKDFHTFPSYWCELSWGSGDGDDEALIYTSGEDTGLPIEWAINAFGSGIEDSIMNCLNDLIHRVSDGQEDDFAKSIGVYDEIMFYKGVFKNILDPKRNYP